MADEGTHAANGVAASEWLAANIGGGVVDAGGTGAHISASNDAQSDDDDDDETSVLEVILGRQVGTACDEDGVDVSVGVCCRCRCWCPWTRCPSRCWSRCRFSCRSPPPSLPLTLREPV